MAEDLGRKEGEKCFAFDTQPNDQPPLARNSEESGVEGTVLNNQAKEGGEAALLRPVKEASDSELAEIEKEQFCPKPNMRKENPREEIRIGKNLAEGLGMISTCLLEKRARTANVGEGDRGIGKEHLAENLCESADLLKKRARTANVGEGDLAKGDYVNVGIRQLHHMMSSGMVTDPKMNQVFVPVFNLKAKEKIGDEGLDVGVQSCKLPVVKEEPDHSHGQSQNMTPKSAECSVKSEMIDGEDVKGEGEGSEIDDSVEILDVASVIDVKDLEGEDEGSDMDDDSVEILDIAPLVERGFVSPFVSSKKLHSSMMDRESESLGAEGPTESDLFREELLSILRKPFDAEEYKNLRETINAGSYLDHHQDVKRKLKAFRYKREKCLVILRGFLYWLQNLTREGAFQPWTDRECLAVEPQPPPLS